MTTQQRLLFDNPLDLAPAPRARRTDPDTSRIAAVKARVMQHAHHRAILVVLEQATVPLNAFQIAERTSPQITQVQVARRMHELLMLHVVAVDGTSERGRCYRLAGEGR